MSVVVTGTVSRINEREAGSPGNTWIERTLVVEDWGQTQFVTVGKELQDQGVPAEGEAVALVCAIRAYPTPKGSNPKEFSGVSVGANYGLTALRRHVELTALVAKGVRAAS